MTPPTQSPNTPAHIYQIFYSEETRAALDPGFIPLDNTDQRPDWREYWPIRNFLLDNPLDEETLYGFFSPAFNRKSTLDSATIHAFIAALPTSVDVVSFSPFFDQGAYHLNTFEHAAAVHPNAWPIWEIVTPLVAPGVDPHTLIMDSRHSIFCNYFAARPSFWRTWLEKCELVFAAAEHNSDPLYTLLNFQAEYDNGLIAADVPEKVFVIERMASLLLSTNPTWRIANFNPTHLPVSASPITRFASELVMLDALKQSAKNLGHEEYLQTYWHLRTAITNAINS